MRYFIQFLFLLELINPAHAENVEVKSFVNNQQQRYQALINEIRCPVCQGQSIGSSNAGLAKDLREKVRELILKQNTDDNIRKFMTDRYGDFIVFKPPVNKNTYLLWFAPFVFLVLGLFFLVRSLLVKKSSIKSTVDTSKAKNLLK
ncbi:cytochrome C biogenesis protein [Candidatus Ruthia magnifica str. Cm (Calyptogena magnifica)]|uniref:Cytochrome c-type biogenesis protein n=1 Tax=Ruthia magnifica subsp. Calyptogena magnifica TaxID=413404 RepID=A1AWN9_RUTMC|nr:cytochrome c-type biogenesis protein [Candidatus Ruthturnera calyptogenae]ABL02346.1 cytochrome C biogenesis protein [Candidatus Ruthia magnifica str. Cm (Calyptogena magnifica)]